MRPSEHTENAWANDWIFLERTRRRAMTDDVFLTAEQRKIYIEGSKRMVEVLEEAMAVDGRFREIVKEKLSPAKTAMKSSGKKPRSARRKRAA